MIKFIQANEAHLYPELLEEMYKLRARQFNDRLGWEVQVANGKEVDEFDNLNPLYALSLSSNYKLLGTFRLLQTTGPHMLSDIFPQLLPDGQAVRSPLIWESTRFCIDSQQCKDIASNGLKIVTAELLAALTEIGIYAGLTHIVTVVDVRMERILLRAKCTFERLSEPVNIGKTPTVAILMECSEKALERIVLSNNINNDLISSEDINRLGMSR